MNNPQWSAPAAGDIDHDGGFGSGRLLAADACGRFAFPPGGGAVDRSTAVCVQRLFGNRKPAPGVYWLRWIPDSVGKPATSRLILIGS